MINVIRFDENVAKLILEKIAFNGSIEFINADRPDLQNDNLGIGIEVTQAIDPKEAEIDSLYSEYKDPNDSFFANEMTDEEKNKQRKRKQKLIKDGIENPDGPLCIGKNFSKGIESKAYDVFYNAVKTKLEKLNEGGYRIYSLNCLFILSKLCIEEKWCPDLLEQLISISKNYEKQYTKIYTLFLRKFICFDLLTKKIDYRVIPAATFDEICFAAYDMCDKKG